MPQLNDFTITKVYEGKSGTSQYGDWVAYNFYTNQTGDKKFGWFGGGKKITPIQGMQIAYMEYQVVQDGEYTNNKVSKLVVKEGQPKPAPQQNNNNIPASDGPRSMYVSYAKDIAVAMIAADEDLVNLAENCRIVAEGGDRLMNHRLDVLKNVPEDVPDDRSDEEKFTPPPINNSTLDDPRKELIVCDWIENGVPRHTEKVAAIYCLKSCIETSHCQTADNLRKKYTGY